jgi:hypothetical protein
VFVPPRVRYSEQAAREAIAASKSYSEALRLGMGAAGGNHVTLRKYAERIWQIPPTTSTVLRASAYSWPTVRAARWRNT